MRKKKPELRVCHIKRFYSVYTFPCQGKHYHNITSQYHHQEALQFRVAENVVGKKKERTGIVCSAY